MHVIQQHQLPHESRGFHGDVVEDSILLAYDSASLGNWFPEIFEGK
jgi:hypothetical protein